MKNKNNFLVWFAMVAIIVFAVAIGVRGWKAEAPGEGQDAPGAVTGLLPDDDKIVANASGTFSVKVPVDWYVEKNGDVNASGAARFALYPGYDPARASSTPPTCKIEISSFAGARGTNLDTWLTKYLHADPTASVAEISRMPVKVGSGGALMGIEWRGTWNGVTSTLVYVEVPTTIFEIAASSLSSASDADNDDCNLDLQAVVANFSITNHEP